MNSSDFTILSCFGKFDDDKGINKSNGVTTKEIHEITGFSFSKISTTLRKLIAEGYIERGIAERQTKTYVINEAGLDFIDEIGEEKNIIENKGEN